MRHPDQLPFISVIIPTRDRPSSIRRCLKSLYELEYPQDTWETIIVDDGSTPALELSTDESLPDNFHLVRVEKSGGPARARNYGASIAKGEYLAFLDDDCMVGPDWLTQLSIGFRETGKHALGGGTTIGSSPNTGARAWHYLTDFLYHFWRDDQDNALIIISNNCAYERQVFIDCEGFDTVFQFPGSEDRDLSWRLLENGYSQGYYPLASVWHEHAVALTASRYLYLQFRYGKGSYYFHRKLNRESVRSMLRRYSRFPHLSYALKLLQYSVRRNLPIQDVLLVVLGHAAHWFGRLYETTKTVRRS